MEKGMTLRLPNAEVGIIEVQDGEIVIHMDRLEAAIKALPLAKLAEFVAGPADGFEQIAKAAKSTACKIMEERNLKALPIGDGRSVMMKRSTSYNPLPEAIEELQERLQAEGFRPGDNFDVLAWEETIPARIEKKYADVRKLRKALELGGVTKTEAQDVWLGKHEGLPYLRVEEK